MGFTLQNGERLLKTTRNKTYTLVENVSNALLKKFICTTMHPTTTMPKAYVLGWVNWLFPPNVSFTATPKPLIAMIDTEPTKEHMDM